MNLIQKIFSFFKKEREKNTNTSDLNIEYDDMSLMNPGFKETKITGELDHPEKDLTEVFQYRKDKKDLLICELELPVQDLAELYQYCTDNNIEIPSFSEYNSLTYPYRIYDEENYIKSHELYLKQDENYRKLHEQYSDYYKVFMKFNKQY